MKRKLGSKDSTPRKFERIISATDDRISESVLFLYHMWPPSSGPVSESAQKGAIKRRGCSSGNLSGTKAPTEARNEMCPFALT